MNHMLTARYTFQLFVNGNYTCFFPFLSSQSRIAITVTVKTAFGQRRSYQLVAILNVIERKLGVNFINIFIRAFFVQNFGSKNYKAVFWVCNFWRQNFVRKIECKTLMKLTLGNASFFSHDVSKQFNFWPRNKCIFQNRKQITDQSKELIWRLRPICPGLILIETFRFFFRSFLGQWS
jgi:hypothetical protein